MLRSVLHNPACSRTLHVLTESKLVVEDVEHEKYRWGTKQSFQLRGTPLINAGGPERHDPRLRGNMLTNTGLQEQAVQFRRQIREPLQQLEGGLWRLQGNI